MNTIDISLLINELMDTLEKASNATQVTEYKNIFVKNNLTPLYDQLKTLPGNEKGALGKIINEFKEAIQVVYDEYLKIIKINEDAKQHVVDYDITVNSTKLQKGAVNPLSLVFREILSYFQSLNFTIQSGEEVMDPKYNFDNLNIPETHPTRETSETFYTKTQSLRTQLTASSAQFIENNQDKEIRIANFGYVYRNDELDATHSPQFNQVDFIWVKEGLNVKNLKWVINGLVKKLYGEQTKTRFRLSNFPFTEPSFEVDATCPFCNGKGCTRCKQSGWIELLGSGVMRDVVLEKANIHGKNSIAFGIGVERVAMLKYGINDVRDFYNNDFRFLKQFSSESTK